MIPDPPHPEGEFPRLQPDDPAPGERQSGEPPSGRGATAAARRLLPTRLPLAEFVHDELVGGLVLLAATIAALTWANIGPGTYHDLWSATVGPGSINLNLSLHAWVNDALMALFFFVVGLEIKRELVVGELAQWRDAVLPVVAAAGGMVLPALLYLAFTWGGPAQHGWGIPMATDIAFVLGALALLGRRAPAGLRLFLLAVAIADDLGAIAVIAVFYSSGLHLAYLAVALAIVVVMVAMRRLGVVHPAAYIAPALGLWLAVHASGVHATVAGVALGLLTPARPIRGRQVLADLENRLHPLSAMVAVPLFALANAGVVIRGSTLSDAASSRPAWGIAAGLVAGKAVGITLAVVVAQRLGLGRLPADLSLPQLVGGATLAGIGFTVALFVAELSFAGTPTLDGAKLAILVASVVAGGLGCALLSRLHEPTGQGQAQRPDDAAAPAEVTG